MTNNTLSLSPKTWWTLGVCAALLLLFAILSYSAVLQKNATFDEPLHSVSGFLISNLDDYRIDPEDPALFTRISAWVHGSDALNINLADPNFSGVFTAHHDVQWLVAVATLFHTAGNDADAYLNRSKFVFMLIGLAAGVMICWWGWAIGGRMAALAATAAFALDPNFIGHSSLVKNDVPLALLMVALMFALWRFGRRGTWWNLAAIVVCCGVALNVKFSGPIFFIITFLVLLVRAVMLEPWPVLQWDLASRAARVAVPFALCLVAGVVSYAMIWACYGFRYAPTPDPTLHFNFDQTLGRARHDIWQSRRDPSRRPPATTQELEEANAEISAVSTPLILTIVRSLSDSKILPETWLYGFYYTYATTRVRGSYLNGNISVTGWWYYFPLCVLYKTPTATLIAAAIALVTWIIIRVRVWRLSKVLIRTSVPVVEAVTIWAPQSFTWTAICFAAPVVLYGGMAMASSFNLGIRHVLPLLPFLHLTVGVFVSWAIARWGKIASLVFGGLGISLAIETCSAWPNYIAFFNVPVGGPIGGFRRLSDSNLDWGQDLKLLADWQQRHKNRNLYLCYFGTAFPDYYHISRYELAGGYMFSPQTMLLLPGMPPGVIAISATNLQGTYMGIIDTPNGKVNLQQFYAPLRAVEPREVLGGTIYLYNYPLPGTPQVMPSASTQPTSAPTTSTDPTTAPATPTEPTSAPTTQP